MSMVRRVELCFQSCHGLARSFDSLSLIHKIRRLSKIISKVLPALKLGFCLPWADGLEDFISYKEIRLCSTSQVDS